METLTAPFAAVGAPGTPAARTPSTPGAAVGGAPGGEPVVLAVGAAGGRDRRRVVATVAVSLVGAAAVSTAVFQAVSGASTSVPMTDPSAARGAVGVWPSGPGAVVPTAAALPVPGAPAAALPPPIASLELRAQQGALPPGVPAPPVGPVVPPPAPPVGGGAPVATPPAGRAGAPVVHAGGGGGRGDGDGRGGGGDRGGRGDHGGRGGWGGHGGSPTRPSTTPTTPPSSSTPPPTSAPTEPRDAPADPGGGQTVTNAPTNSASAG